MLSYMLRVYKRIISMRKFFEINTHIIWASPRESLILLRAINNDVDHPAHSRSLISAFVFRSLKSIYLNLQNAKFIILSFASVAEQVGLSLAWSQTPDRISRDVTHASNRDIIRINHS